MDQVSREVVRQEPQEEPLQYGWTFQGGKIFLPTGTASLNHRNAQAPHHVKVTSTGGSTFLMHFKLDMKILNRVEY